MTKKAIFSHVRYLLLFLLIFFSDIKFIYSASYSPKSVQFGQSAQFGGGLDNISVEMNWDQNSVMPKFGRGGAEGSKTQKLPHFSAN